MAKTFGRSSLMQVEITSDYPTHETNFLLATTEMYYNFASKNVAMYELLEFPACKPNDIKVAEIFSHTDY
jgi:hypothetical protein